MTWGNVMEIKKDSLEIYDTRGTAVLKIWCQYNGQMVMDTLKEKRGQYRVIFYDKHLIIPRVVKIKVFYEEGNLIENIMTQRPFIRGECPVEWVQEVNEDGTEQTN